MSFFCTNLLGLSRSSRWRCTCCFTFLSEIWLSKMKRYLSIYNSLKNKKKYIHRFGVWKLRWIRRSFCRHRLVFLGPFISARIGKKENATRQIRNISFYLKNDWKHILTRTFSTIPFSSGNTHNRCRRCKTSICICRN